MGLENSFLHEEITGKIIEAFYAVYNKLGYGFLEKVYENSMLIELKKRELDVIAQFPIDVFYDNEKVGHYVADLIVENKVIVEIKATRGLAVEHEWQLINYLKAMQIEVGLLMNFGEEPEFKRKVFSNKRK